MSFSYDSNSNSRVSPSIVNPWFNIYMVNSRAKGVSDAHSFCWHHNRITSLFIWYDCIRSRMLNGWVFSVNEKVLILVNLWTCSNKGCYRNSATNENNYNYKLYKECPTLDYSTNFNLSFRQIKLISKQAMCKNGKEHSF